jgi:multiple sugar transport system ATP-binding protein
MARVALEGLSRKYEGGEGYALAKLSMTIEDGELVVVVGPSGCGKSTMLRLIAGLDTPDAGAIKIGDRDVAQVPPQERDVAMVFQGYALYPHLSVEENIAFPLKMRGVAKAERATRVDEVIAMLGLGKLIKRRPGELSGGERQRVAMGRAIVRRPALFLFDEPLANLDAALRAELRVELASLVKRLGTTAIYVTHDQVEAMTMADRIAVMNKGALQQLDTPRAIYEAPANTFVAGFLGTPPINLVKLTRDGDALKGAGSAWPATTALKTKGSLTAGVRSEHVRIGDAKSDEVAIRAKVTQREPLGAETHLLLDASGVTLRARTPGFGGPMPGDDVTLAIANAHITWFDGDSGALLP